jgi:hypothetical protein
MGTFDFEANVQGCISFCASSVIEKEGNERWAIGLASHTGIPKANYYRFQMTMRIDC